MVGVGVGHLVGGVDVVMGVDTVDAVVGGGGGTVTMPWGGD